MLIRAALLAVVLAVSGCVSDSTEDTELAVEWMRVGDRTLADDGLEIFAGRDDRRPLSVWYVRADPARPDISVDVIAAQDTDGRMSVSDIAAGTGACVAINAGYFRLDEDPSVHVGLLMSGGQIISHSTTGVYRDDQRFTVLRASIGFSPSDSTAIGWTASRNDSVFVWDTPLPNSPGNAVRDLDLQTGRLWKMEDAVSAGPSILEDGTARLRVNEEVFFGTSIPDVHPRSAAGITPEGHLILMVVDGRQGASAGVDLRDLALLMREAGAVDALNLDGGGSSTLVVDGEMLNLPTGGTYQREVVSAIVLRCE